MDNAWVESVSLLHVIIVQRDWCVHCAGVRPSCTG